MLRCRIDDAIRPELQRLLQQRSGEHVVDDQCRAALMGDFRDLGDVDEFQRRVGRALHKGRLGVRPHRLAPGVEVGAVDERRLDAEARQQFFDDVKTRAEQSARRDDMVAGFQLPISAAVTAAMPVAVARAASAPSSSAMRRSNMATVGLAKREYMKPGASPLKRASACSIVS